MTVGFTGTSRVVPLAQREALAQLLLELAPKHIDCAHGGCVGADDVFDELVVKHTHWHRWIYPSDIGNMRSNAWMQRESWRATPWEPRAPLVRNHLVVERATMLVACPRGPEMRRSGTWSTVRLARKRGLPVTIVWPDGFVTLPGAPGGPDRAR